MTGFGFEPPCVEFPPGLVDRRGFRLRPGSAVTVRTGAHAGLAGEVVAWAGDRGVEVLAGERLVTVDPFDLERTDARLDAPVTVGLTVVEPDPVPTLLVVTVGNRDLVARPTGDSPFPPSGDFPVEHAPDGPPSARARRVSARAWGAACLAALERHREQDRAALVVEHLDAPIVGRVLREAALPAVLERLVFVVTDQDPAHPDDTVAFGELLRWWVEGSAFDRDRPIRSLEPPIVLHHAPHVLQAVVHFVSEALGPLVGGVQRVAVARSGGTPAMGFGSLLAALAVTGPEQVVRDIDVPLDQPIIEMDVGPGHPLHGLR
ncbi:hypothetical protein [Rhabdothermincola sediminis]|uniref:hypothetical protein n=1 Tax=Rhabdothermincola sediminis TaxID=2751370 RepID=UPI001AA0863F|nr:hypothetical protein [Rhabdothermincola sediminis]